MYEHVCPCEACCDDGGVTYDFKLNPFALAALMLLVGAFVCAASGC
jgi:hypothetical protein